MRAWQFSKPKNPGFGISKLYYLSVLASKAVLPTPREIANPKGDGGALTGFCVPLQSTTEKQMLDQPLQRGAYTLASRDQKTVLRLVVISKEEAGFDPEAFAQSSFALGVSQEAVARIRGTWNMMQVVIESHDAMVYPALDFMLAGVARLADLSDGVVGDSISERYLMPEQVFSRRRTIQSLPVYAEEHVDVKFRLKPEGMQAHTLGMQKFAMPELEINGLQEGEERPATTGLLWLAQQQLLGTKVQEGYQVGAPNLMFEIREGGFDRGQWEGTPVWELLPPTAVQAGDALRAWSEEIEQRRA